MKNRLRALHTVEDGQMALFMVMMIFVICSFFAMSMDAGAWYFDHRTAQNQAEAAALAAVMELPAKGAQTDAEAQQAAFDRALAFLQKNGESGLSRGDCPTTSTNANHIEFQDLSGDLRTDTVTVCVRRGSDGIFSKLSGVNLVRVSASATARTGPVNTANVMPWAVIPPDPDCPIPAPAPAPLGRNCKYDANGNGDFTDPGDCDDLFAVCPWGLTADRLYGFKSGGGGNTGIIDICGNGAVGYKDCLNGDEVSGVTGGETITVGLQGGNLGTNTDNGLQGRDPADAWDIPTAAVCDVVSTPAAAPTTDSPGHDPDGKALATTKFVNPTTNRQCASRLVLVPILHSMPPTGGGSSQLEVLGVATFGVAKWNRTSNGDYYGTSAKECADVGGGQPPLDEFSCGMVWGYLFSGITPPDILLNRIGNTNNPFAPLLIALVD
jgi:hypothetical protein